ncbi:MAG TPA: carboxypeptidase-like regulatory domain-containing protein, partial [Planctomycetota bacterium]|nr:carboxypeptidase-like regulatory domain-containing protein [Planctomycetota bacterium]
ALSLAAAFGLAAAAVLWAARPRADDESAGVGDAAAASVPPPAAQPLPPLVALPGPDASLDPAQPLDVPEAPANRAPLAKTPTAPTAFAALELTLVQPCGQPAAGVRVQVAAPRSTWKPTSQADAPAEPTTSGSGTIAWPRLPAQTPLLLHANDPLGFVLLSRHTLSLDPGERRELTVTVDHDLRSLEVAVTDGAGRPIDALVELVAAQDEAGGRQLRTWKLATDADGLAAFGRLAADSVSVAVNRHGFAPTWRTDVPLDRDPLRIELALDPGLPVDVEIVDESGQPRDVDAVEMRGTPMSVLAQRVAPGRYRFASFPEGANGIVASVQGRIWQTGHEARHPVARLVVPAPGALSVTWRHLPPGFEPTGIFVVSVPPGWGSFELIDAAARARGGPLLLDDLVPGHYELRLHGSEGGGADLAAKATVTSGTTAAVRIEP